MGATSIMNVRSIKPLPREDLEHIMIQARRDLECLRGARLFATGGTGFFGKWLVSSFVHANRALDLGATMVVLTRSPGRFQEECPELARDPSISMYAGDVRSFDFPKGRFSHIVHGAVAGGNPLEVFESIVEGTRRTLQFAAHSGARRFLFLSSGAVYGPQPATMTHIPETYSGGPDPLQLSSGYGEGKRSAEHLCCVLADRHGLEAIIARCFAFSGPYLPLNANYAIGNFIGDILAGRAIKIQGDGTPHRSYLYAADLAVWLWALLVRGSSGRAYNVGSDEHLTIKALAEAVAGVAGLGAEIQIAQQPKPGATPSRYVPSIDRARTELGLECRIKLEEGISRMLAWLH